MGTINGRKGQRISIVARPTVIHTHRAS
jgi:hypothetical protein